jgi:hypothetical protein
MTEVQFPAGAETYSLCHPVQTGAGACPACYPMGNRALSPKVKWFGHEADHSPPSNAEVKNVWNYTSTPQYIFTAWCLVKQGMSS